MTDPQIRDLGPAFSSYLQPYHAFCNQDRTAPISVNLRFCVCVFGVCRRVVC